MEKNHSRDGALSRHNAHFILLKDFRDSYDNFPLKVVDIDDQLEHEVIVPMEHALEASVTSFRSYNLMEIQEKTLRHVDDRHFVVTLDAGEYFINYDFSVEITRACYKLEHAFRGRYFRLPRSGPQLIQQGMRLREQYIQSGNGKPIILCDDGIGTGKSLKSILDILYNLHLQIHKLIVLINPHGWKELDNIDIETLIQIDEPHIWLNERDLYWGVPRSGLSFTRPYELRPTFGIPYSIDVTMVEARVGLTGKSAIWFRHQCLQLNILFFKYLEYHHNRQILFQDCDRLSLLGEELGESETRVVDFIKAIDFPAFRLVDSDDN